MRFRTRILDYKGKAVIKLPKKFSKMLGIKIGDRYTTNLTPQGQIIIQFLRHLSPPVLSRPAN